MTAYWDVSNLLASPALATQGHINRAYLMAFQHSPHTTTIPPLKHYGVKVEGDSDEQHDIAVHGVIMRRYKIASMTETTQVSQCTASEEFISLSSRSQSARLALKWKFALIQPSGE